MAEPTCIITGYVAGHPMACGDCDPCGADDRVSPEVQRLIREIEEWNERYSDAVLEVASLKAQLTARRRAVRRES